jgi:phenylacetate-CoA ligase
MQVEKILVQYPGLGSNYLITLETIGDSDVMTVEVELEGLDSDIFPDLQKMTKDIQAALKSEILLKPQVKLVKKGSLPQSEGKAVRVHDLRHNKD